MRTRSDEQVAALVRTAVAGNAAVIPMLNDLRHEDLWRASKSERYVLRPDAVVGVLRSLRHGTVRPDVAQAWASFMRRGYLVRRSTDGIRPVEIEYEAASEEAIAQALGRMDELGDVVDGSMSEDEIEALSAELERGDLRP